MVRLKATKTSLYRLVAEYVTAAEKKRVVEENENRAD